MFGFGHFLDIGSLIAAFSINPSKLGVYVSPNAGIGTGGHNRFAILRKF